jgi:hypothetical protein
MIIKVDITTNRIQWTLVDQSKVVGIMEMIATVVAVVVNVVTVVGVAVDQMTRMMIAAVVVAKCNCIPMHLEAFMWRERLLTTNQFDNDNYH